MARPKRPKIEHASPDALAVAGQIQGVRDLLRPMPDAVHGNTRLHDADVLTGLLCGFFDPLVRSQRTVGQLSEVPAVQEQLDVDRIARSTLSDALRRFNTQPLFKVLGLLKRQLPPLRHADANLEQLLNAETACITRAADPKTVVPLYIREFVALFRTKRRDKRRGRGWEVMDWQGVRNYEKSAQNYFGRILLTKRDGARWQCGTGSSGVRAR